MNTGDSFTVRIKGLDANCNKISVKRYIEDTEEVEVGAQDGDIIWGRGGEDAGVETRELRARDSTGTESMRGRPFTNAGFVLLTRY